MQGAGPQTSIPELLSSDAWRDPASVVADVRERDPVLWMPGFDAWLVTRHDDVKQMFTDSRLTTDPRAYQHYQPPSDERSARWLSQMPFRGDRSDDRVHARSLVSSLFTPRAVARMERGVRQVVEEFAAPLRDRKDVVDLAGEFTVPVSATAAGRILGVPAKGEDESRFRKLARKAARGVSPILSDQKRRKSEHASVELCEYVLSVVEQRTQSPCDDLISDLVAAYGADSLDAMEDIVRVIAGLIAPGTGTTGGAAARALRSLFQHPDQLALLRRDRSLMDGAIEELLRFHSGLFGMPRYVLEDFELRDQPIRKGQLLVLSLIGANRDPRVFPDPDRLDLRRVTKESLAFGQGPHYCIGANLAKVQLHRMLNTALDLMPPGARLLEDQIRWSARGIQSRIKSLPVDFAERR